MKSSLEYYINNDLQFLFRIEAKSEQSFQKEAGEVDTEETQRREEARREQQRRVPLKRSHDKFRFQLQTFYISQE